MRCAVFLLATLICCTSVVDGAYAKPKPAKAPSSSATAKPANPPETKPPQKQDFSDTIPILDHNSGNSSGVSITTAAWDSSLHVDPTYYAFAQAHKEQMNKYDFYYRLEIVPQFKEAFEVCRNKADFLQFFENLFKTETGALVSVTANIQHRWSSSSATNLFNGDAALVLAAKGASIDGKPGTGCFFDFTARPSFPWTTWNGGRAGGQDLYDDFQIKFNVTGAKASQYGLVNAVVKLFTDFSAAARWFSVANPLASPVATASGSLSNSFQDAVQGAGTFQNKVTKVHFLNAYFADADRQHGRIVVQIPDLFREDEGNANAGGNLIIYVRRQASFALQGIGTITPQTIFNTAELVYRQCTLGKIASGGCDAKDNATIRTTLAASLKAVDGSLDEKNPAAPLFDLRDPDTIVKPKKKAKSAPTSPKSANAPTAPADGSNDAEKNKTAQPASTDDEDKETDRRKLVFDLCKGMREVSLLQLHLSTLDEIAVRWAFTREGHVQEALSKIKADLGKAANDDAKDKLQATFKETFGHTWQDIEAQCWNAGDAVLLAGTAKALGRPLEGSPKEENLDLKSLSIVTPQEKFNALNDTAVLPSSKTEQPYVFDSSQREKFNKGTFGLDFSHYEIDVDGKPEKCRDRHVYDSDPACSCKVDWLGLAQQGFRYVYYEHTVGSTPADFSAAKVWTELESLHQSKKLYRGAYHFLMPNPPGIPAGDASVQANNFLKSIGAVNGQKPLQLAPVLDMEGTHTPVGQGDDDFRACPSDYLRKDDSTPPKFTCDMWYKVNPQDIAALAQDWINRVEKATGKKVTIYTNTDDWWDPVMGKAHAGEDIITNHPIWIARYTKNGPEHDTSWGGSGVKWGMPPLPVDATYPPAAYSKPNFWQFTDSGKIKFDSGTVGNGITCNGKPSAKGIDFNYVPVAGDEFEKLFVPPSEIVQADATKVKPKP